ncbi:FHA domain protein [Enhygromyxa salina]|uniref:FHA domain protein n=1 Tax=Enhygromyxa salina TaxID=215803 RepID=A0A2S9XIC5_9BACT|nr:FHA domain-containing protein [Enhygromyxa salina]PRP92431.1 FHA domain protein [Enhygromyxa salina]
MKPRRQGQDDETGADERARRPRDRAQLRAALALEEAGELQEAARMFEYVGEHAQAASLRLEHADTLRDEQQRLAVLREGCARNPATTHQGQALHRALGEALLRVAEAVEPGARRRALALEAAQALEAGQRAGAAGRLYEQLGLLARAVKAYTEAGAIEQLEAVHEILDQRDQQQKEQRSLELEVDAALATGRRGLAHALLLEHVRDAQREGRTPLPSLALALHDLERRLIRGRALCLSVREIAADDTPSPEPTVVRVIGRPQLRLGRGPQCELTISGAAISREHAELALAFSPEGEPHLVVRDLGSRAGSFLDGEALAPGEDWSLFDDELPGARVLALGIASSFELWSRRGPGGGPQRAPAGRAGSSTDEVDHDQRPLALLREAGLDLAADRLATAWTAFAPLGGPLWITPTRRLPVALNFEGERVVALAAPGVRVSLAGAPVGPGEAIELLVHDRARFEPPGDPAFELEVCELYS